MDLYHLSGPIHLAILAAIPRMALLFRLVPPLRVAKLASLRSRLRKVVEVTEPRALASGRNLLSPRGC